MRCLAAVILVVACATAASAASCNQWCGLTGKDCESGLFCADNICTGNKCAGAKGDPELKGLDGRTFYFNGEAGKVFNFISEQNHQVNALFVEGPHMIASHGSDGELNGTFIGAMGLKLYDTKVQIDADEEGQLTVSVDERTVNLTASNDYKQTLNLPKVKVTVNKYRSNMGESVHMITDLYNLLVYSNPRQWDEEAQQITRGHLNLVMAVQPDTYFLSDVHGVLGQIKPETAADNSFLPPELQHAFLGEGSDMDYKVSNLFADDFKYNRFNVTSQVLRAGTVERKTGLPKLPTYRRRLHERDSTALTSKTMWLPIIPGDFSEI